ncbi:KH domain-containing protein [Candidatus Dojkabacteria bacterium]|nr:KH domain-containing protein [Candidatus Dojkabacteria bacterium]
MSKSKKEWDGIVKQTGKLMSEMLKTLDIDAETKIDKSSYKDLEGNEEDFIDVNIEGEDLGVLIGYMGKNLRSFQKIFGMILNKAVAAEGEEDNFVRVVIDVSGYRDNRKDSLEAMANRIRDEVVSSEESVDLPPMSSFERRVIHVTLREHEDVTTESFGEGPERHVRVSPA